MGLVSLGGEGSVSSVSCENERWPRARVTSSQPEPASWPRVLARAAPGNLARLHQPPDSWWPPCSPCRGCWRWWSGPAGAAWPRCAETGGWSHVTTQLCCQPAATTATVPLYRTVHCTIATVQSTTSEDTLYSIPELNLSIYTIDKQLL